MKKPKGRPLIYELRKIIGQTQEQFAVMIGASKDTVVSLELGRIPLTEKMHRRIRFSTGAQLAHTPTTFYGAGKIVRKFKLAKQLQFFKTGRPYTKAHFDEYRKLFGDDLARNALREMLPEIQHLVMEAVKAGPAGIKNRLPALQFDFYEWVSEVEAKFKIAPLPSQRCFA